jgi:hypothetical protein
VNPVERSLFITGLYSVRSHAASLKPQADSARLLQVATSIAAACSSLTDAIEYLQESPEVPFLAERGAE